jgi:cellulose biosynthesis protein BcsQ
LWFAFDFSTGNPYILTESHRRDKTMSTPYIVTISSEKGGVGKTTLATNLAIYLKALHEDLPVTLFSFDNHFSVDRMFRIGKGKPKGDVSGLFRGALPEELAETGEYGVQFVPSCEELHRLRRELDEPTLLAASLTRSAVGGIVIIDTRPDLDIFTQNALFAADRVIVPVKDAPSLENCRHIYEFFDEHGLSRRPLRVLPCLVDARIHFDGPFRDPYQLLKAYAINRGYRCLEGYIAKSPKVESLNTNPEGKIYPVLTHGRQTDVHVQLAHVARQVYLDTLEPGRRLDEVRLGQDHEQQARQSAFAQRRTALSPCCLVCGRQLVHEQQTEAAGYFACTADQRVTGFIEEECFTDLVFRYFYGAKRIVEPGDSLWDLFRESAQRSYFVLRRTPHTRNFYQQQLSFYRFDDEGLEVSHKVVELQEYERKLLSRERSNLYPLLERTLFDGEGKLTDDFLLIRKVSIDFPEEILFDEHFARFTAVQAKVARQLP